MKSLLLGLVFTTVFQLFSFGQTDSIYVADISFSQGNTSPGDTLVVLPVMQVRLVLSDPDILGKITVDVMDTEGVVLLLKKEFLHAEFAPFWSDEILTLSIGNLYPETSYTVKTTLQTPELFYLPQLINAYPQ